MTLTEANLVQAHTGTHQHREGAWADFGIKRTGIAGLNAVELGPAIRDGAGQEIETARRAFGVGDGLHVLAATRVIPSAAPHRRSPFPARRRRKGRCDASRILAGDQRHCGPDPPGMRRARGRRRGPNADQGWQVAPGLRLRLARAMISPEVSMFSMAWLGNTPVMLIPLDTKNARALRHTGGF